VRKTRFRQQLKMHYYFFALWRNGIILSEWARWYQHTFINHKNGLEGNCSACWNDPATIDTGCWHNAVIHFYCRCQICNFKSRIKSLVMGFFAIGETNIYLRKCIRRRGYALVRPSRSKPSITILCCCQINYFSRIPFFSDIAGTGKRRKTAYMATEVAG